MIHHLIFILLSASVWEILSGLGAFAGAIIAGFYTCYTYQLLSKTNKSLELSTTAIKLNQETLDANKKLNEYQVYKEFGEKLYMEEVLQLITDVRLYPEMNFNDSQKKMVRFKVLNHIEDLSKFHDDGLISLDSLNSGFGAMILYLGKSEGVKQIIREERRVFKSLFSGFENLYESIYNACNEQERSGFEPKLFPNQYL